MHIAHLPCSFK